MMIQANRVISIDANRKMDEISASLTQLASRCTGMARRRRIVDTPKRQATI